jgi:predicted permease
VYFNFVTPRYFATMRTPLLAGRDFDERDTNSSSAVAIVNESLARRFFPRMNPLAKRFHTTGRTGSTEIVGMVKDSKYESVRETTPPTVFLPAAQAPPRGDAEEFVIRSAVAPSALIPAVRQVVMDVNADIPLEFHTLAEQIDDNLVQERLLAALAGFLGGLALLLAMIGLYGVLSYFVAHRQAEFGIRMALGAQPASILRMVMADVIVVMAGGLAAGLAMALVSVKVLQRLLFGLEPRDGATILSALCLLSAMALLAGYLPARRATQVDPVIALRSE